MAGTAQVAMRSVIRRLWPGDREKVRDHLLRVDGEDRALRFGGCASAEWRAAPRPVLNTFQAILRNRTRGQDIIAAQRHKRRRTSFGKLERFPGMQLSPMDDVAGCRLIFQDAYLTQGNSSIS